MKCASHAPGVIVTSLLVGAIALDPRRGQYGPCIHVAVIHATYLDLILRGHKTIESRLSLTRRPPYGKVHAGERIYFKERSGPIRATAIISRVDSASDLTPRRVDHIRTTYNEHIVGPARYWKDKSHAKFATLLWLSHPEPVLFGPSVPKFHGSAWACLPCRECVYPGCVASDAAGSGPLDEDRAESRGEKLEMTEDARLGEPRNRGDGPEVRPTKSNHAVVHPTKPVFYTGSGQSKRRPLLITGSAPRSLDC